jgi:putative transcriptional regulator
MTAKPLTTKRNFKSDAFEAIHSAAQGMQTVGAIPKATMRQYDELCLIEPLTMDAINIKSIREQHHVSQPLFAKYLNTSASTIQKWETGSKRPSGMALKLLAVVQKHGLQVLA